MTTQQSQSLPLVSLNHSNGDVSLHNPSLLPNACGFLWNKKMMIQMNCRGYAVAQFMQPEPAKYAHAPLLEAKTFIQPEHPYFSHHPGRFFYLKDECTGEIFSLPFEPVKAEFESFEFTLTKQSIYWTVSYLGLTITLRLSLPSDDCAELWQIEITNNEVIERQLSLYSYFPVGYMSWMNQSAAFEPALNGILCKSIAPYQKVEQYFANQGHKDCTVLLTNAEVTSFETRQSVFEGEGIPHVGLHRPLGVTQTSLDNGRCFYQTPAAVLHSKLCLQAKTKQQFHYVFAPVLDSNEAQILKQKYLDNPESFSHSEKQYQGYLSKADNGFSLQSDKPNLDHFINHWLPRQVFYHGDVNRLSTDPQTRNYLQDALGMLYISPEHTKDAIVTALSQQKASGAMPDGILLHEKAELKYINQVPHTDHCVWVIITVDAYLKETNDYGFLDAPLPFADSQQSKSVFEHVHLALIWLVSQRDERGLSYINQGDWCDPMNMVGYKGKGVSSWLTLASAYALSLWADVAEQIGQKQLSDDYKQFQTDLNHAVNTHCWDKNWYGRGITDDNVLFGVASDNEGKIYLNPQSWAMLSKATDKQKWQLMDKSIQDQLFTPYGVMMLAPSYTKMREDVGRVTQKFPGTAENGSVYNHAAVFYIYALYQQGECEQAFKLLMQMLVSIDDADAIARGQLPVFIPNYYRGAYHQYPEVAGKSSQLFNTGTVAWVYRCIIEELCGLKGCKDGLMIAPKLPKSWQKLTVTRRFRGAQFTVQYKTEENVSKMEVYVNGDKLTSNCISQFNQGQTYQVLVKLSK